MQKLASQPESIAKRRKPSLTASPPNMPEATTEHVGGPVLVRRVALVGAGHIADIHAKAVREIPSAELAGIVDPHTRRALALSARNGGVSASTSLAALLRQERVDAAHILVPSNLHRDVVLETLTHDLQVLVEAPLAGDLASALEIAATAHKPGAPKVYVNHNFVFHPAFQRLTTEVARHSYGTLEAVFCTYAMPLRELAAGQIDHWMFRRPANLLLEQAVHPLSQVLTLSGPTRKSDALAGPPYGAPTCDPIPRTLSIQLQGDTCSAQLHLHFGATFPVWQITALCSDGVLTADMIRNRIIASKRTKYQEPLDNVFESRRVCKALRKQAMADLISRSRTILGSGRRSDPFYTSMISSINASAKPAKLHPWVNTPEGACYIVQLCEHLATDAFPTKPAKPVSVAPHRGFQPQAIVTGDGPLGRHVVRALTDQGIRVGVVSPNVDEGADNHHHFVRYYRGNIHSGQELYPLLSGADFIISADSPTVSANWSECERDVKAAAIGLAKACLAANVNRLVHLSTIDALYLGVPGAIITGSTPADPHPEDRTNYARASALTELMLLTLFEERSLPVCILRPGLVVGEGVGPYHRGIGQFVNERHCLGWNEGRNPLPFVLAEDVAKAAVAAATSDGQEGRCYNLIGDVRLTAHDYIDELAKATNRPLRYHPRPTPSLYSGELLKWIAAWAGGRKRPAPSLYDLRSRALVATIDCSDTKQHLGWHPIADRDVFIRKAISVHGPRQLIDTN